MSCVRTPQVEKKKSQKLLGRKTVEVTETLPRGPLTLLTFMLGQDVIPGITKMTKTTIKDKIVHLAHSNRAGAKSKDISRYAEAWERYPPPPCLYWEVTGW